MDSKSNHFDVTSSDSDPCVIECLYCGNRQINITPLDDGFQSDLSCSLCGVSEFVPTQFLTDVGLI